MTRIKNGFWGIFLLLAWICCQPALARPGEVVKQKKVSRSFPVGANDVLNIDHRYGNITVTHWNKNEVEIRVEIESKARDERVAQENLERVTIEMNKTGNAVSAVTTLKKSFSTSYNNPSLTVDYYISMPAKLASVLALRYGNISLPEENEGRMSVLLKYGNLYGGDFGADLNLEADYSNVEIGNMKTARMDLGYVGSLVGKDAENLTVESKYSKVTFRDVNTLSLETKYGSLTIGKVDRATINMKYSNGTIDFLKEELKMEELGYGTLDIEEVSPSFKRIEVDARYGNLHLGISSKAAFSVDAEDIKYGTCRITGFTHTDFPTTGKTSYKGKVNGGGNGEIYFEGNNYGNLSIKAL